MHQKRIGPGLREFVDKEIGIRNHQVCLQRQARHSPQRPDDRCTHGNIGHEMSVHHVNVDTVGACALSLGYLLAQAGEIGREDRGRQFHRVFPIGVIFFVHAARA
jgi:hypothetical protein